MVEMNYHPPQHLTATSTTASAGTDPYYSEHPSHLDDFNFFYDNYGDRSSSSSLSNRVLTFLDTADDAYASSSSSSQNELTTNDILLISGFAVMGAGFVLLGLLSIRAFWTCQELYEWNAIRLILPFLSVVMAFECATLAYDVSSTTSPVPTQWAIAVYMLEATVAPGLFIVTFVLTFLAYRIRSMPFCFVYRGPSRQALGEPYQDEDEEVVQPLVRPAVLVVGSRLFSLGLLILSLVVNFDVVWNQENLAGRTGWATLIQDPTNPSLDHIILSLLPMALSSLACLYFSCLLWRYGCEFSMVIYPSIINPWMFPLIGTSFMIAGQMFGPDLFPILSNFGIFLFMLSIVRTLYEVRHDMNQAGDLGGFLTALGNDRIANTVSGVGKATNGDTASTGRLGGHGSERDGTLSVSFHGSTNQMPPAFRSTSLNAADRIAEEDDDESEQDDIEQMQPVERKASVNSHRDPDYEFASQRVAGIAKRPPKLKAGQKPSEPYVVL